MPFADRGRNGEPTGFARILTEPLSNEFGINADWRRWVVLHSGRQNEEVV